MARKSLAVPTENDARIEAQMLALAASPLGPERDSAYEDLAEVIGDAHLFRVAVTLRTSKLIEWGTNWAHCWLTQDGKVALERVEAS